MLEAWQIILITILAFLIPIDKYGMTLGLRWPLITSFFMGLILGDMPTAIYVGGTLQLLSLGVASIGGSSVPEYATAAIVATVIAHNIGGDLDAAVASGLAIGIPVALLGVQLDVIGKTLNGFIVKKSQTYSIQSNYRKMINILYICPIIMGLSAAIPVFVAIMLGTEAVEVILNFMPTWFTEGLTLAGKMLPAVGIALLLNYMPMKKFGYYILIGFVFTAYLSMSILGVTLIAVVVGFKYFQDSNKNVGVATNTDGEEFLEDE